MGLNNHLQKFLGRLAFVCHHHPMKERENKRHLEKKLLELLTKEQHQQHTEALSYDWPQLARKSQLPPPGEWRVWLILAGRGFGKTRTGAETLRQWVTEGQCRRMALIGETEAEVRQVMVEGPSGLLSVHPPSQKPLYESSKHLLTWPNGAIATCFSAEAYEHLRGPQFDGAWIDELAKFKDGEKVWDQLMFGLRLGSQPRVIITTTPRPTKLLKRLAKDPAVRVTTGSTFENAKNLAPPFLAYMHQHYAKRWLGRQEIYAEFVEETEGALWTPALIEMAKDSFQEKPLKRLVIAVDPAVSHRAHSDETGIVAAGLNEEGVGVVLEDLSVKGSPQVWVRRVVEAYHRLTADRVIAEVNMGGDLVEQLLRLEDQTISYKPVRAMRGKVLRAEPVVSLYERGQVWHAGNFPTLEDQLCSYVPGTTRKSPDRLDALVWALTDLMLTGKPDPKIWG